MTTKTPWPPPDLKCKCFKCYDATAQGELVQTDRGTWILLCPACANQGELGL